MLADIADVIIDVYAVESALARAEKIAAGRGTDGAATAVDVARVFASDAADRMSRSARQVRRALAVKNRGASIANLSAPVVGFDGIDGVAARRRIADACIAAGKYPL